MAKKTDLVIGTLDLEKGMRASSASTFATILIAVFLVLAFFNSAGFVLWTQRLPSSPTSAWVAERATAWDQFVHVAKANMLAFLKNR